MNAAIIGQENIVERFIIGLLANGNLLDDVFKNNRTIVDMKNKWKVIYPFEMEK